MLMPRMLHVAVLLPYLTGAALAAEGDNPLKVVTEKYVAAYNKGGDQETLPFWTEDADYTTSDGEVFRGRKAIMELMAGESAEVKGTKLKITDAVVRLIKPDVALQDGMLEFTAPDGVIDRSRFTSVWVKNKDQWQLTSVHNLGPLESVEEPVARENPLEQLGALAGEWVTSDSVANVQMRGDWMLGKQFFKFDFDVKPKMGEPFTVMQIIGWDPVDETLRSWFFDSSGGHGSGLWSKTDTGWSVLSTGVTPAGQIGAGTYNYALSGATLTLNIVNREVAGQSLPDAEVKFTRK